MSVSKDNRDRIARLGTEAWKRLKRTKDYHDWIKVGEALQVGREWAMTQARSNQPVGKAYNMAFGEWLQTYKLHDMDKGERSRLFNIMDVRADIEKWRATLTITERLKLNHPSVIMRKFKAATEIPKPKDDAEKKPGLKEANVELSGENERLKAHIAELESSRKDVDPAVSRDGWDAITSTQLKPDEAAQYLLIDIMKNSNADWAIELGEYLIEQARQTGSASAKKLKKAKPANKAPETVED